MLRELLQSLYTLELQVTLYPEMWEWKVLCGRPYEDCSGNPAGPFMMGILFGPVSVVLKVDADD